MTPVSARNTAFSTLLPTLQLAWDSTSLGELKTCPRKYQLSIVEGWTGRMRNVHLDFGIYLHSARERYYHATANGATHDEALLTALRYAMEATWNTELKRPWFSEEPTKTRLTLMRTLVWYLDQWREDPLKTVILANGRPAVELSFRMDLGRHAQTTGEPLLLCGHLDRVVEFNGQQYVSDLKTTKMTLGEDYFAGFSPDNQMSTYTLASQVVYSLPVAGIIIDAAQVAVTFSRFGRGFVQRTPAQIAEWQQGLGWWLSQAEAFAEANHWPMNDKACFRCPFRGVCSHDPQTRDLWLEAGFAKRTWDPLQTRGDV